MSSRHARHELDESEVDVQAPLLSLYSVLYRLEQEGRVLPVRVPLTTTISFFFIRSMFVTEPRAPRPGEPKFPPPSTLVKKPAHDLNAHVLLQELVEHNWGGDATLDPDDLTDDDRDAAALEEAANNLRSDRGGGLAALRRAAHGPTGFQSAGVYHDDDCDDDDDEDDNARFNQKQSTFNSKRSFGRNARKACIWAEIAHWDEDLETVRVDFLNAHGIRDVLRNASARKSRAVITQFLPPDPTAPPHNEQVACLFAGNFFRSERRVNLHDYRDPRLTLNERGNCDSSSTSEECQLPRMMREKIENSLRDLVQCIEHYSRKRVLVLKVVVKLRRGAVWLLRGDQLTYFDHSIPRISDHSILLQAAAPSSRAELRRRLRNASRRSHASSTPQSLAQTVIYEMAVAKQQQKKQVLKRTASSVFGSMLFGVRAGSGDDVATLGAELRQLKRSMSRATMPGHEHEHAARSPLLSGSSGIFSSSRPNTSTASPSSSASPSALRGSRSAHFADQPSPSPSAVPPPSSASALKTPEKRMMKVSISDVPEMAPFNDADDDDAGDRDHQQNQQSPSPSSQQRRRRQSESSDPGAGMGKPFESSKMVSFAGDAVFADCGSDFGSDFTEDLIDEEMAKQNNSNIIKTVDDAEIDYVSSSDDDFFDDELERQRRGLRRQDSMMRAKLTEKEKQQISATRWLRGADPLLSELDQEAISLLRAAEITGTASKRLSQFRSAEGIVAPSLLFLKMKEEVGAPNARGDLDKFFAFRERLLHARVDAALRKEMLVNLREGNL